MSISQGAQEGDLVETFSKLAGFYMHYSDEAVPELVGNWNVKRLAMHRDNRHKDGAVLLELFTHLDNFLKARKCALTF